jgi:hypothetical protein
MQCDPKAKGTYKNQTPRTALSSSTAPCKAINIPSPDSLSNIKVQYRNIGEDFMTAYLLLKTPTEERREVELPDGFQDVDLLWAPDSKKFFVNGGNGGGYWGFWVYVYLISDPRVHGISIARDAQRDMVESFPPCKATWLDRKTCEAMEKNPEYNMSGIDWVGDASAIVVMAEVPCSGSSGGIMCQIMGYELEVPTGRVVKRMTAREFAANWQKSMAWKFQIPDPPHYCDKPSDRTKPGCAGRD